MPGRRALGAMPQCIPDWEYETQSSNKESEFKTAYDQDGQRLPLLIELLSEPKRPIHQQLYDEAVLWNQIQSAQLTRIKWEVRRH